MKSRKVIIFDNGINYLVFCFVPYLFSSMHFRTNTHARKIEYATNLGYELWIPRCMAQSPNSL